MESSAAPTHVHPPDQKIMERISDLKEAGAKLSLPVQYLKGVGPKMAERFAAKKITTVEDLLYFLPRTYEDRREIKKIKARHPEQRHHSPTWLQDRCRWCHVYPVIGR
ncbi:MAG: hypothetical protein CVU72_07505, partial [Deltaproteobacteria bacterium HGW-Deltaproteobacteria-7]